MTADQFVSILSTVTLLELMITIGLGATTEEIGAVMRKPAMLLRAALANYVVVPAAAVGLLLLFRAQPMVAVGILIAAVCPGAPYGPPFTGMVKGNVASAVGLMVVLAGSSAVVAPLLLKVLIPIAAGDAAVKVDAVKMVVTLVVTQFLPLCVGLYLRARHAALAQRLSKPAKQISLVLNLLLLGTIIIVQFRMLISIRTAGYAGMLTLLAVSVFAGWVLGGSDGSNRKAMIMATSVRNVGVALVIASGSFAGTPAVTATTAYALVQTIGIALLAMIWDGASGNQLERFIGHFH